MVALFCSQVNSSTTRHPRFSVYPRVRPSGFSGNVSIYLSPTDCCDGEPDTSSDDNPTSNPAGCIYATSDIRAVAIGPTEIADYFIQFFSDTQVGSFQGAGPHCLNVQQNALSLYVDYYVALSAVLH
jgi:hypothetical protein